MRLPEPTKRPQEPHSLRGPPWRYWLSHEEGGAWRTEYGGLRMDQAKRLKELERENGRLKKLLAEAELDKAILREAASPNC